MQNASVHHVNCPRRSSDNKIDKVEHVEVLRMSPWGSVRMANDDVGSTDRGGLSRNRLVVRQNHQVAPSVHPNNLSLYSQSMTS